MSKQDLQKMFDSAVHVGHRTHKWNPRMKKFIFGERNGIHVINLEMTAEYLDRALGFLSKAIDAGQTVLFVSTKPQSVDLLKEAAESCGMPYVVTKWIPGLLTNFATIKTRIKYLADLKHQKETGDFSKYTKKEAAKLEKVIAKLQASLGGVEDVKKEPDIVFVLDVVRDDIVVREARKLGKPLVGIVDTNADPTLIDYPIPGNDDSLKSVAFFVEQITDALKKSSKAKK